MFDGPRENAVRETLPKRPAGELHLMTREQGWCFAGLFNGALKHSTRIMNGRFFCGKAECEWGWPGDWEALRDAGLITFKREREDYADGGHGEVVTWDITDKGWKVRDDDLAWTRELMAARRMDEAAVAVPTTT